MTLDLSGFRKALPNVAGENEPMDGMDAACRIRGVLGVDVPMDLVEFWSHVGGGYFADRELHVFSLNSGTARGSLLDWNTKPFWREIFPPPSAGGPVFFAENCFGAQLGFRWDNGRAIGYLLEVDTLEAFRVSESVEELFSSLLVDRYAITDPVLLADVKSKLGALPPGYHYAPLLNPLGGGRLRAYNYHLETPIVHLQSSIATFKALRS